MSSINLAGFSEIPPVSKQTPLPTNARGFDLSFNPTHALVVKFGEEFNDEDEHLLVLPHGSHQLNLAQTLFETIVLAVPQKKVHPGIENGSLQSDILDRLEELHPNESTNERKTTDPRWDALKKLKKD